MCDFTPDMPKPAKAPPPPETLKQSSPDAPKAAKATKPRTGGTSDYRFPTAQLGVGINR